MTLSNITQVGSMVKKANKQEKNEQNAWLSSGTLWHLEVKHRRSHRERWKEAKASEKEEEKN